MSTVTLLFLILVFCVFESVRYSLAWVRYSLACYYSLLILHEILLALLDLSGTLLCRTIMYYVWSNSNRFIEHFKSSLQTRFK